MTAAADVSTLPVEVDSTESDPRDVGWKPLALVAAITFLVFAPLIAGDLSPLDDLSMLSRNKRVTEFSLANLVGHWTTSSHRIYMPLPLTIWSVLAVFSAKGEADPTGFVDLAAWPFKLASVLSHACAAGAAAWAIAAFVRSRSAWPAVVGGLVVGLHPLQVESVGWTTGLKDVLCGLFAFLSIGAYARFALAAPRHTFRDRHWRMSLVFMLLACASKPTAMTLPAAFLLIDLLLRGRRADLAKRIESLAPMLAVAIAVAFVILSAQHDPNVPRVAPLLRPLVAADTVAFYLVKLVAPHPLLIDYGRTPMYVQTHGAIWYAWLLPAAIAGLVVWSRSAALAVAGMLFLVPLGPVSGLTAFDMQQYSTVADHYMYQPLLGVGLAVALAMRHWPGGVARIAAIVGVAAFAAVTVMQVIRWTDMTRLHQFNLERNPRSAMVAGNLGWLLYQGGDLAGAQRMSEHALALNERDLSALSNLALLANGREDYRLAASYLERAMPSPAVSGRELSHLLQLAAMLDDRDLAERAARRWVQIEPYNMEARLKLRDIVAAGAATRRSGTQESR